MNSQNNTTTKLNNIDNKNQKKFLQLSEKARLPQIKNSNQIEKASKTNKSNQIHSLKEENFYKPTKLIPIMNNQKNDEKVMKKGVNHDKDNAITSILSQGKELRQSSKYLKSIVKSINSINNSTIQQLVIEKEIENNKNILIKLMVVNGNNNSSFEIRHKSFMILVYMNDLYKNTINEGYFYKQKEVNESLLKYFRISQGNVLFINEVLSEVLSVKYQKTMMMSEKVKLRKVLIEIQDEVIKISEFRLFESMNDNEKVSIFNEIAKILHSVMHLSSIFFEDYSNENSLELKDICTKDFSRGVHNDNQSTSKDGGTTEKHDEKLEIFMFFYKNKLKFMKKIENFFKNVISEEQKSTFVPYEEVRSKLTGLNPKIIIITYKKTLLIDFNPENDESIQGVEGYLYISESGANDNKGNNFKIEMIYIKNTSLYEKTLFQAIKFLNESLYFSTLSVDLAYKKSGEKYEICQNLKKCYEKNGFKWKCVVNDGNIRKIRYEYKNESFNSQGYMSNHGFSIESFMILNVHFSEKDKDGDESKDSSSKYMFNYIQNHYSSNEKVFTNQLNDIVDVYIDILFDKVKSSLSVDDMTTTKRKPENNEISSFKKMKIEEVTEYFLTKNQIIQNSKPAKNTIIDFLNLSNPYEMCFNLNVFFKNKFSIIKNGLLFNILSFEQIEYFSIVAEEDIKNSKISNDNDEETLKLVNKSNEIYILNPSDTSSGLKLFLLQTDMTLINQNKDISLKNLFISILKSEKLKSNHKSDFQIGIPSFSYEEMYLLHPNYGKASKTSEEINPTQVFISNTIKFMYDSYYYHTPDCDEFDNNHHLLIDGCFLICLVNDEEDEIEKSILYVKLITEDYFIRESSIN